MQQLSPHQHQEHQQYNCLHPCLHVHLHLLVLVVKAIDPTLKTLNLHISLHQVGVKLSTIPLDPLFVLDTA